MRSACSPWLFTSLRRWLIPWPGVVVVVHSVDTHNWRAYVDA